MSYSSVQQQDHPSSMYYPTSSSNFDSVKSSNFPADMHRHLQAIPHRSIPYSTLESIQRNKKRCNRLPSKANPASKIPTKDSSLSLFMTMPLDIMFEVLSHLHPMDLLTLFRTTKSLRSILQHPHARKAVWRESLFKSLHVPPPCPPQWNEIQYISLVFDDWCQNCHNPNVEQISWLCRVRYCDDCLRKQCVSEATLQSWLPSQFVTHIGGATGLQQIFAHTYIGGTPPTAYGAPSIPSSDQTTNESTSTNLTATEKSSNKAVYFIPQVRESLNELDALLFGSTVDEEDSMIEEKLKKWCEDRKADMATEMAFAQVAECWNAKYAYRKLSPGFSGSTRTSEAMILLILVTALVGMWWERLRSFGMAVALGH